MSILKLLKLVRRLLLIYCVTRHHKGFSVDKCSRCMEGSQERVPQISISRSSLVLILILILILLYHIFPELVTSSEWRSLWNHRRVPCQSQQAAHHRGLHLHPSDHQLLPHRFHLRSILHSTPAESEGRHSATR